MKTHHTRKYIFSTHFELKLAVDLVSVDLKHGVLYAALVGLGVRDEAAAPALRRLEAPHTAQTHTSTRTREVLVLAAQNLTGGVQTGGIRRGPDLHPFLRPTTRLVHYRQSDSTKPTRSSGIFLDTQAENA